MGASVVFLLPQPLSRFDSPSFANLTLSGFLNASSYVQAGAANIVGWNGRSFMDSPSDGVIRLANNAQTGFTRLQLGGTTSSFPAIKRNGTGIDLRLADDSGAAPLVAQSYTANGAVATTTASTAILDINGNELRVLGRGPNGATNATMSFYSTRSDGTNPLTLLAFDVSGFAGFPQSTQTYKGSAPAAASTMTRFIKAVASIANAAATSVLTITIPNAAHAAGIRVKLFGSLGAGGAIGVNEATGTICYDISVARTAGVNAVATISAAYGSATSSVAGAATITVAAAMAAVSGAVGATNTIDLQVTISRGTGAATNHTCLLMAEILNGNGTGITIA